MIQELHNSPISNVYHNVKSDNKLKNNQGKILSDVSCQIDRVRVSSAPRFML